MSLAVLFTYFKYCGQEVRVCSALFSHVKDDRHFTSLWGRGQSGDGPGAIISLLLGFCVQPATAYYHWQMVTLLCLPHHTHTNHLTCFRPQPYAARESDKHPSPGTISPSPEEEPWGHARAWGKQRWGQLFPLLPVCCNITEYPYFLAAQRGLDCIMLKKP